MNITEANAVNTVLRHFLNISGPYTGQTPSHDETREATELLADRANKALGAGLTPTDVRAVWENQHRPHTEKSGTVVCIPCLEPWPCPTVQSRTAPKGEQQ